tara:strand:- start:46028 stop:46750 length:723 start_codon:yes stop_codon:yes gene_type:complete
MNKVFLKANWLRLASANYIIDPAILDKHIPNGTLLEAHNGKHYVSLVGFRYCETRLLNIRVPYHHIFEEINLRFYVKREISPGNWRSEVAFAKLFFPKKALTLVAKYIYKENYETLNMRHSWTEKENHLLTSYGLHKKNWHNFEIQSDKKSRKVASDSSEFFFSKHYWGTSQIDHRSSTVYEIEHPDWEAYDIVDSNVSFDFNTIFGSEFKHLTNTQPDSVHLFKGSEVIVNKKKNILKL